MKHRLILTVLALLLCSGCAAPLVPNEYTVVTEHSDTPMAEEVDALTAESYEDLRYAMRSLIDEGVEQGVIRAYNYDGDVEKDISAVAYEVWKNDPMGAYAVEFITTDCTLLLSYYEINVGITYRDSAVEADKIRYVRGSGAAEKVIQEALRKTDERVVLRISAYSDELDCKEIVRNYCSAFPERQIEEPKVSVSVYPEEGSVRIVEIGFAYENTPTTLAGYQSAVNTVLSSATNYVSYRDEDQAKAEMLFTYLMERFEYTEGETETPVYSLLCEGIANSRTFARIFQVLCDRSGLECHTVMGYLDGAAYHWNILGIDGAYHHVDLMRAVREGSHQFVLYSDEEMERYSWERDAYPLCDSTEETVTPEQDPTAPESEADPSAPEQGDQPEESDTPELPGENPENPENPEHPETPEQPEPLELAEESEEMGE